MLTNPTISSWTWTSTTSGSLTRMRLTWWFIVQNYVLILWRSPLCPVLGWASRSLIWAGCWRTLWSSYQRSCRRSPALLRGQSRSVCKHESLWKNQSQLHVISGELRVFITFKTLFTSRKYDHIVKVVQVYTSVLWSDTFSFYTVSTDQCVIPL